MLAIPFLKHSFWGIFAAIALSVAALAVAAMAIVKAGQFAHKWGGSGLSTTVMIVGGLMVAGVAASWVLRYAGKEFVSKVAGKLGLTKVPAK